MHDKVSVVDRFRFRFSSRNSFQGAKSVVMQIFIVFGPDFRGKGAEVSGGHPLSVFYLGFFVWGGGSRS